MWCGVQSGRSVMRKTDIEEAWLTSCTSPEEAFNGPPRGTDLNLIRVHFEETASKVTGKRVEMRVPTPCEQVAESLYRQARLETQDAGPRRTLTIDVTKLPPDLNPVQIATALARLAHERAPGRVAEVRLEHPAPRGAATPPGLIPAVR